MHVAQAPENWMTNPDYLYVGRPRYLFPDNGLGNPVVVGQSCPICGQVHAEGGSTLPCYAPWLAKAVVMREYANKVLRLRNCKHWVCWCRDESKCHGLILMAYAKADLWVNLVDNEHLVGKLVDRHHGMWPVMFVSGEFRIFDGSSWLVIDERAFYSKWPVNEL